MKVSSTSSTGRGLSRPVEVLFLALCICLTACSPPPASDAQGLADVYSDASQLSNEAEIVRGDAIAECMKLKGFDYVPVARHGADVSRPFEYYVVGVFRGVRDYRQDNYLWVSSLIEAATSIIESTRPIPGLDSTENQSYDGALLGGPGGSMGCVETSTDETTDKLIFEPTEVVTQVNVEVIERLQAEPEAQAWMYCFSEHQLIPSVDSLTSPYDFLAERVGVELHILDPDPGIALSRAEGLAYDDGNGRFYSADPELQAGLTALYELEARIFSADRECIESSGLLATAESIRVEVETDALEGWSR